MSDSLLDVLHECAKKYRENEEKRVREIKEKANKRKAEKKTPKKKRSRKKKDEPKLPDGKKVVESLALVEVLKKKEDDRYVKRVNDFIESGRSLYSSSFDKIPNDERAECFTPWCMHFVNGYCIHRECIVAIDKQKKYENNKL